MGSSGQKKLSESSVLVIGAGGLGTPLSSYLAAMGIGYITIVDGDVISETNLHRQFLYHDLDIGNQKSQLLASRLSDQNPNIKINAITDFLTPENMVETIRNHDFVCDCTDNSMSRSLIDMICDELKKPLIFSSVVGWVGYVAILHFNKGIKLNDIFTSELLAKSDPNDCTISGVLPSVCGVVASIAVTELVKCILKDPLVSDGQIICFDGRKMVLRKFYLKKSLQ